MSARDALRAKRRKLLLAERYVHAVWTIEPDGALRGELRLGPDPSRPTGRVVRIERTNQPP